MHSIVAQSSWTPRAIAGLVAWHEILSDSDYTFGVDPLVSALADRAGVSGTQSQATGANQASYSASIAGLNNTRGMVYDGARYYDGANAFDLSQGLTVIRALRITSLAAGNYPGIFRLAKAAGTGGGGADGIVSYTGNGGAIVVGSPNATTWWKQTANSVVVVNTAYILSVTVTAGGAVTLRKNGASVSFTTSSGSVVLPDANSSRLFLGRGWNSTSLLVGEDGGAIVVARALDATELLTAERYLAARRGITI